MWKKDAIKKDTAKPQFSLIPSESLTQVAHVMTYGAAKYSPNNWKLAPHEQGRQAYLDAALRHIHSALEGYHEDPESGLPHLAHAAASTLMALWHDQHWVKHSEIVEVDQPLEGGHSTHGYYTSPGDSQTFSVAYSSPRSGTEQEN